jgi:hypothetical protein
MTALRLGLVALVGILLGAPVGVAWPGRAPCASGARECPAPKPADEAPGAREARAGQHPCDWVETCQLPCGGEGGDCCHAEWDCPPDATLPRC